MAKRCPLGGDGTHDCTGCTYPCNKSTKAAPKRNRVVQILMDRDGVTEEQALSMVEDCRSELYDAMEGTSLTDIEDIIMLNLGLEPDYLFDII